MHVLPALALCAAPFSAPPTLAPTAAAASEDVSTPKVTVACIGYAICGFAQLVNVEYMHCAVARRPGRRGVLGWLFLVHQYLGVSHANHPTLAEGAGLCRPGVELLTQSVRQGIIILSSIRVGLKFDPTDILIADPPKVY
ncbi:hypothetical protein BC834DRAFT_1033178 [Gloeopeniophorella convolvens]|nr:hypothetical protein BC834DRAFT_1033178 [Gloeopeniophorella convolvens]